LEAKSWRWNLTEVAIAYTLILGTLWSARPYRTYVGWTAVIWLSIVILAGMHASGGFGLGLRGLRESLWALGLALWLFTVLVLCAIELGTWHFHYIPQRYPPMSGYFVWSFVQQFILQNLFLARLLKLFERPSTAIWTAGLLLSAAHLPNLLLTIATLLWGVGACWLFFKYRNLYVVGLIHFLFGFAMAMCVPTAVHHNMRVGRGYAHYHQVKESSQNVQNAPVLGTPLVLRRAPPAAR
jgi:membrane protease YdiL (CAAX protease family)